MFLRENLRHGIVRDKLSLMELSEYPLSERCKITVSIECNQKKAARLRDPLKTFFGLQSECVVHALFGSALILRG